METVTADGLSREMILAVRDRTQDPDLVLACDRVLGLDTQPDDCDEEVWDAIIATSADVVAAAYNARITEPRR